MNLIQKLESAKYKLMRKLHVPLKIRNQSDTTRPVIESDKT